MRRRGNLFKKLGVFSVFLKEFEGFQFFKIHATVRSF
jgi:hypothetical protein